MSELTKSDLVLAEELFRQWRAREENTLASTKSAKLHATHARAALEVMSEDAKDREGNRRHMELAETHWERDSTAQERIADALEEMLASGLPVRQ